MTRLSFVLSCAAALLTTSIALAEPHTWKAPIGEPSSAAVQEAKALYIAGNRAVEQGRWSDALVSFEKSYSLSGNAAALFNIATTLRALGRHVESRDAFEQLLAKHPALDPEVRARAEKLLAEEKDRIALVTMDGVPSTARVFVDGHEMRDSGARPLVLEVDPGKHALRVEAPGSQPFTRDVALSDGEKKSVEVKLLPESTPKSPTPDKPSGSILSSPWFWGAIGVVVVGGAAGAYFYDRSKQLGPDSGVTVKL